MSIDSMSISVVVPFYNAEETLSLCIDGLLSQKLQPHEIILVDNNSVDRSAKIAKKIEKEHPELFKYVLETRQGPGYARNSGVWHADAEIICFTDADCVPEPNWLSNIIKPFKHFRIGAVAGRIVGFSCETIFDKFHYLFTLRGFEQDELFTEFTLLRGGFPTANLAVRKEIFEKIEGFDESLGTFGEDYDLCARIYQTESSIQYIADAIVKHKHRNTLISTWKQSFLYGFDHSVLLKKHLKRMLIVELPRFTYSSKKWPASMWLNLTSADKKVMFLIIMSGIFWPFWVVFLLYLIFLVNDMGNRARQADMKLHLFGRGLLAFLLVYKSLAMTMGRVKGSLVWKTICF